MSRHREVVDIAAEKRGETDKAFRFMLIGLTHAPTCAR